MTVADEDAAIAVGVAPGQAGDAPPLVPRLDRTPDRVPAAGEGVGDEGFDGDELRSACLARDVSPDLPPKANRGPDKWARDAEGDEERNRVERRFGRVKPSPRVATRCQTLKVTPLGPLHLTLGFLRLRRRNTVNTP